MGFVCFGCHWAIGWLAGRSTRSLVGKPSWSHLLMHQKQPQSVLQRAHEMHAVATEVNRRVCFFYHKIKCVGAVLARMCQTLTAHEIYCHTQLTQLWFIEFFRSLVVIWECFSKFSSTRIPLNINNQPNNTPSSSSSALSCSMYYKKKHTHSPHTRVLVEFMNNNTFKTHPPSSMPINSLARLFS